MNNNIKRLYEFKRKFENWDDNRIKEIYNKLVEGVVCTFQITSLETGDQIVKEIQRVTTQLQKSNHFHNSVTEIIQYILYFLDNMQSILTINPYNKKDEFEQFKDWFIELLCTDCEDGGLTWNDFDGFTVEWDEFTKEFSFEELWNLLDEEGLT